MSVTRIPLVGLSHDEKHRYYWGDGQKLHGPMPGVTSAIDPADDKEGLIAWKGREVAACSLRNFDFLTDLVNRGGLDNAVSWLSRIPDFQRDTAADLGSAVHRIAEQISRGEDPHVTDEQREFAEAYRRFVIDYDPVDESLEQMVCSLTHGYGGKYDAIKHIRGKRLMVDVKTSKSLQPKIALQLAGYAGAEFVGKPNDPRKYGQKRLGLHTFDGFAVLHIRPDLYARGYSLIEFKVTADDYEAFLHCLSVVNWRRTRGKAVIGESIPIPVSEVAA